MPWAPISLSLALKMCLAHAYPAVAAACCVDTLAAVINHIHSSVLPQYNFSVGPVRVRGVALALAATLFTAQLGVTVTTSSAAAAPL